MKDPFAPDDDGGDTDPSGEPAGTDDAPEEAVGQHLAGVLSNGSGPGDDATPRSGSAGNGSAENGGSRGKTRELGWLERLTNESELVTTADEDGGDPASGGAWPLPGGPPRAASARFFEEGGSEEGGSPSFSGSAARSACVSRRR